MKKVLILTDGKAGHENQSKAFARSLGYDFVLRKVSFRSGFWKAASYILDFFGVSSSRIFKVEGDLDGLDVCAVVGTGSGVFYAVKNVARSLGVSSGAVLYPRGYRLSGFDCIMAPSFDRPRRAGNIVELPANLVAGDEGFYAEGVELFSRRHVRRGKAVAVIVGGPNRSSTMDADWMRRELERIFAGNEGAEFWVTTSRRTPAEVERVVESFPFDYSLIYSKDHFNPIPAFVKLAAKLYVTAESTGMLSEACTFGEAEVHALDNLKPGGHKFRRFLEDLRREGYVGGNRKIDLASRFERAKALMGV